MATETRRDGELKLQIDPRVMAMVEEYVKVIGADPRAAVEELLRAGIGKLTPRNGGANGKRKAKGAVA